MALYDFLDIRFADPVVSIDINNEALVFGSMMGRLVYYALDRKKEKVLTEISDEHIAGVCLGDDNEVFLCIGDLKGLIIRRLDSERADKEYYTFEKVHTHMSCELSQVKMHKETILLGVLEPRISVDTLTHSNSPVHLYNLKNFSLKTVDGVRFGPFCVFSDFDGKKLLFLEYEPEGTSLNLLYIKKGLKVVKNFPAGFGKVGFFKLLDRRILYVHKQKTIKIMNKRGTDKQIIGKHDDYIVAINHIKIEKPALNLTKKLSNGEVTEDKFDVDPPKSKPDYTTFILSADCSGHIRIWENSVLLEEIRISSLQNLTAKYRNFQYFSMGYPYLIHSSRGLICLTTDIGVLLITSPTLQSFTFPNLPK